MKWVTYLLSYFVTTETTIDSSLFLYYIPEYNVLQPSPLNEKVLKEKRKKLRETFDRVLKMYVSVKVI